ncbi:uncharacterized protein EI97DRAFT_180183 [Westerdykella ornata]|uniref:Uncharacterized protein n=1 Tax=Westerdykella ornata TaxID=318751 RepID=A0A6A6JTJ6_WESOR|nr:uncharacterized protein EI97DRAFT_180183 [Westerdykella ornata]KAF2279564.1 hypothetical protein EI97DRAFT_180183 [Westerdykella ornata]
MEEEQPPDLAATMGFTSFGSASTAKKRRHSQTNNSPPTSNSTGANSLRLGVRPKLTEERKERGEQEEETNVIQTTETDHPKGNGKAIAKAKNIPATSLAEFLSRGQALPDKPATPSHSFPSTTSSAIQSQQPHHPNPHQSTTTPSSTETISFGGHALTRADLDALRQGVRDEKGDVAFFLPSFVEENPWAGLNGKAQVQGQTQVAAGWGRG